MTQATTNGATSGRAHTWLYYLKDNAVMDGTSRPLLVTISGTHSNVTVWYSVFAGVDQTPASYTVANGFTNTAASGPAQLSTNMAVNANQQAVYVSSIANTTNATIPGYTVNANWTSGGSNTGTSGATLAWKTEVVSRAIPGANTTDNAATSAITPTGNIRWAISGMSLAAVAGTPVFTIANPTTPVASASICASTLKVPIHAFNIGGSISAGTLTNFQFTTSGTYIASDISNFKIWWNSTNSLASATSLATNAAPAGPGVQTFSAFSLNIPAGTTYYFWITADIAATVGNGNTLTVSGSNSSDMTTAATKAGGPTNASGTQTFNIAPALVTVSGGGTFCGGTTTLNASGGSGGSIYYQGTTSGGTSTATPSISQIIASSGTYYFRAYDGSTCWGPEGSATVTISTVPTAVTVSGGGTFCSTATITATGGTGGTIYYQGTTSGGTSTATASSSQPVAASGTYYFRALNGTCWGTQGSAAVTINPAPTAVTVAGAGSFCSQPSVTLTASGGTGGTIYYQGTTTNGTSTATPSSSQAVSATGTYYFRSQTALGCWGTQGSAAVTMGTTPTAVTVTGGGSFCGGSTTLTASGGTGGTIYYQGTTSNGTSVATASSSQTVAVSGTYYFRARDAGTCWGTQGSAVVAINAATSITLGADPSICRGVTTANITYSATTGIPNQYSTVYDATALAQNFSNVTNATLNASPIVLVVPAGAASGTYNYSLTVRNSTTGCVSSIYSKTITILPVLGSPGTITGGSITSQNQTGLTYSIPAIPSATSYTWTVPAGWSITAGSATNSITVTSGNIGQNGNITVQATNSCGTSSTSTLAVSITVPHNNCNQCHITHTSYGTALAIVDGNANLCISCHNPAGTAQSKPFNNSMKSVPGASGNSHSWDATAINFKYGANVPTDPQMLSRMDNGKIICSTCHNQHSLTYSNFLRASNDGDAMCKQCHSVRNVGRYIDNPSVNIGSHPVGLTYNGSDPRFLTTPASPFPLVNLKVECSSCHSTHYAASSDGYALRMAYSDAVCKSCHVWKTTRRTLDHEGMSCLTCHIPHKAGLTNVMLIRDTITTPFDGMKPVVFSSNATPANYAVGSSPFNGVCEACHNSTFHYGNTGPGTSDARHNPSSQKCTTCHAHEDAFYPQTNCLDCHKDVVGSRRQIVDANGNGTGTGGDFKRTSHHVSGSVPNVTDCILCHYMGDHRRGTVKLLDPDLGYLNVITYNPADEASAEKFCLKCHDANGAGGDVTPFSDNVTVPVIDSAMWVNSAHKGDVNTSTCLSCHDNGHGSNKSTLIGPYNYSGPGTGTDLMNEEEGFCLGCHGGTGVASVKVHLAFSSYTNTATNFYKHDPTATYRVHVNGEGGSNGIGGGSTIYGTNRHVECVDCHNPHGAKAGTATAPTLLPTLTGASGVEPIYPGAGSPTGFTWQKSVTQEYQVCYKCHSSYTTLPTYLPAGWGTAIVANGLGKLTFVSAGQVPDSRDMAREYNPNNNSFHPVMALGKNSIINAGAFVAPWTSTARMYCSDCHDNPNRATAGQGRGPHGSNLLHLLDGTTNFKTVESAAVATEVCSKCHQSGLYLATTLTASFSRYYSTSYTNNLHNYHRGQACSCYMCHDSHGSEIDHLFNFNYSISGHTLTSPATNSQNMFVLGPIPGNQACLLNCHTSHSTSTRYYNPSY